MIARDAHRRSLRSPIRCCVLVVLVVLAGCRTVRVYERGHLAHPTMATDFGPGPSEEHMRSVHEGATGGSAGAGGGCGCN